MSEQAVRELHQMLICVEDDYSFCGECNTPWPCRTMEALGPDILYPPMMLPPRVDEEGNEYWPGDPRFAVRVRSVYGPGMEQVVEAYSLREALEKAADIPFTVWADRLLD